MAARLAPDDTVPLIRAPAGRYFCPVPLPWFSFRRSSHPVDRLRRAAYEFNERTARQRLPVRALRYGLTWPFTVIVRALEATRTHGSRVRAEGGPPVCRQFASIVALGIGCNITPKTYYLFRLWRAERRARANHYIQDFEGRWLLNAINRGKDVAIIDDKSRFATFCALHGLPTVPILAEFGPGGTENWAAGSRVLPANDLFIKQSAATAVAGAGAECWLYDGSHRRWRRADAALDESELLGRLRALGAAAPVLLQERVRNHERVAAFSPKALCSVRAVTVKQAGKGATHFRSCLRMPVNDADVDHPVHGGLAAPIRGGGILGAAVGNLVGPAYAIHPATGAQIAGSTLPHFDEAITLALRAHDLTGIQAAIGWDIAITSAGPTFLEANSVWGTDVMQTSFDEPLGNTTVIGDLQALIDDNAGRHG